MLSLVRRRWTNTIRTRSIVLRRTHSGYIAQKATGKKRKLITLPFDNLQDGITRITAVRNTIMHGNYEQAASQVGRESVPEYFQSHFATEIEDLFEILCNMMDQIDIRTGQPRSQ